MAALRIDYGERSAQGRRGNNEDSALAIQIGKQETYLLAVADGMGGGAAGEVASETVIKELENSVSRNISESTKARELKGILERAYVHAQKKVHDIIEENPAYASMGTTLTALLIHNNDYVWGNIGDSRLYQFSSGRFKQVTKDHSHIQELIDQGKEPDLEYIATHSNLITKVISSSPEIADIYPLEAPYYTLQPETALILCSDGLITSHPEEEISQNIQRIYFSRNHLNQVYGELIQYAMDYGSRDNITIASFEYGMPARKKATPVGRQKRDPVVIGKSLSWFKGGSKTIHKLNRISHRLAIIIPASLLAIVITILLITLKNRGIISRNADQEQVVEDCEWINQLHPFYKRVTEENPAIPVEQFPRCDAEFKELRLIMLDDNSRSLDTIVDTKNNGSISLLSFIEQTNRNIIIIRIEALVNEDSVIYGDTARVELK